MSFRPTIRRCIASQPRARARPSTQKATDPVNQPPVLSSPGRRHARTTTDSGLSEMAPLPRLESVSLRHCSGLGAEATLCLSKSPRLESLNLAHCPRMDDAALGNLVGLRCLQFLEVEGCEVLILSRLRGVLWRGSMSCRYRLGLCRSATPARVHCSTTCSWSMKGKVRRAWRDGGSQGHVLTMSIGAIAGRCIMR